MVIFGQSDHVAFRSYLEATAAAYFNIGTLKFSNKGTLPLKHCHVKTVPVAISNQYITSIADIYTIRVIGYVLASNTPHELTVFIEDHHTMTL